MCNRILLLECFNAIVYATKFFFVVSFCLNIIDSLRKLSQASPSNSEMPECLMLVWYTHKTGIQRDKITKRMNLHYCMDLDHAMWDLDRTVRYAIMQNETTITFSLLLSLITRKHHHFLCWTSLFPTSIGIWT